MVDVGKLNSGIVKFFNDVKGYGFIACDDPEEDVFIHHYDIVRDEDQSLKKGQRVHFILERHPADGTTSAKNLTVIRDEAEKNHEVKAANP